MSPLAPLALATLLAALATSIANVALPALAADLLAPFAEVQQVVVVYLVALTALVAHAGRLGDRVGRGRVLRLGIALFTLASTLCALAPSLAALVAARALQGAGAALMTALAVALASEVVPAARTGRALGLLGATSAAGTALGPVLGGLLLSLTNWRGLFVALAPLGLVTLVLASRLLPADSTPRRSPSLSASSLLRDRPFAGAVIANGLVSAVMMGTLVVTPFYLARVIGLSAAAAGLVLSIGPTIAALTGIPAGRAVDRLGAERAAAAGLGVAGTGAVLLAFAAPHGRLWPYVLALAVTTAGYALFQAGNTTAVVTAAGPDRRGVASGLLGFARNLGLAAGASVLGTVFARASGTADLVSSTPDAIGAGARVTYLASAVLVAAALGLRQVKPATPALVAARG